LVDFDSDYLVAVVMIVDCNNHNLIDFVGKQVDFVVEVVVDFEQQYYFFVMLMMMVVVVPVHIPPLHHCSILPEK
jgi:hypothetical protein